MGVLNLALFVNLNDGKQIELDPTLSLEERKELCQKIIDNYPECFEYSLPRNNTDVNLAGLKVEKRLEIMGTYILQGTETTYNDGTITQYKGKKIIKHETCMAELERKY